MRAPLPARTASTLKRLLALALAVASMPTLASDQGHSDPAAPVVLALALILVAAKIGGHLAIRAGQPAVLGELMVGVLLGNATLLHVGLFEPIATNPFIDMFSRVGVIILLFEVGLESTVAQMMKVGASALMVACVGVAIPFALGWLVSAWLLPHESMYVHMFIGATLTATSVGITARVLRDLEKSTTPEARIILGAAVIDDVLGLVILAVVTGIIQAADAGTTLEASAVVLTLVKALVFLFGSLILGRFISPRMFSIASRLKAQMVLLAFGLGFCFLLAFLADFIGLAPIVGAFAAGLILEEVQYEELKTKERHTLEELVHPISYFLVPVFFVVMGMRTDLAAFVAPGVPVLALCICVVAIVGKVLAGLGVLGKGIDRLSVGLGMIPRGEVGLIFASIGAGLTVKGEKVVSPQIFSAVVVMVIVTTMVTPPLLKVSLGRLKAS